jgi:hypothetical protein
MRVSATAKGGVIDSATRLRFVQRGARVLGRYGGGSVLRGYLVGTIEGARLRFRYTQREASGEIHGGASTCDVIRPPGGGLRILEHFRWRTREGSGTNVFETDAAPNACGDSSGA